MKKIASTGLMACAFLFGTIACNQSTDTVEEAQETTEERFEDTAMEDKREDAAEFMTKSASSSMMAVEASKLAQQKATNPQVKEYANMVVNDHTALNKEMRELATSKNITMPDSMSNDHMDHVRELNDKTGADFDKAYMDRMVSAHEDDVERFEDVAEDADYEDAEVKAFASKTVTKLRQHLERAKQIREGLQ